MRVARLHGIEDVRLSEEDVPVPGPGESLVRVEAVGLCGSDLHWFGQGGIGDAVVERPVVPGHELAGTAVTGPHEGRLVAVDPAIPCGRCALCREGHRNLCPTVQFSGHGTLDGGLRQFMAWPTDLLTPLPEGMTAADGAVLEPLGVALHAWDLSHARAGATVAVVGCGPLGLLLVQLALACGAARVIAVEALEHRRAAARRCGAGTVLAPDEARDPAVWQRIAGDGCDVSFEVCGSDETVRTALLAARPGARVLLVGIPDDDRSSFPAGLARRKGLTLVLVRRMKEMHARTVGLVASGRIDVRSVVSATHSLDDAPRAFAAAVARQGLKIVIDPQRQ